MNTKWNTKWNTKEEYLAFVKDWKAIYKELTILSRQLKFYHKAIESLNHKGTKYLPFNLEELGRKQTPVYNRFKEIRDSIEGAKGNYGCWNPKGFATYLILIRANNKERSKKEREKSLELRKMAVKL